MSSYIIIGASRGLGYQYLKTLSKNPSNTVIGVVRTLEPTEAKIKADGLSNVHVIRGDLTDPDSLITAANTASGICGGIVDHLIVNGAYFSLGSRPLKPTDYADKGTYFHQELAASMDANVSGVLYSINAFLPYIRKSKVKKVIAISSGHADVDVVVRANVIDSIPYALSKAALNLLVAKYAIELKSEEIIFLALSPGSVLTMVEDLDNIPPHITSMYENMKIQYRDMYPDWKGPATPEQSVELQLQVIEKVTLEQSGEFLSHHGNKQWL